MVVEIKRFFDGRGALNYHHFSEIPSPAHLWLAVPGIFMISDGFPVPENKIKSLKVEDKMNQHQNVSDNYDFSKNF